MAHKSSDHSRRSGSCGYVFVLLGLLSVAPCTPTPLAWAANNRASDLLERAQSSFAAAEYGRATEDLVETLRLNPKQPLALKLLGLCYQLTGRLKQAESRFLDTLELHRNDAETWFFLGRVYYMEHSYDRARNATKTALQLDSQNPQSHELLALTLESVGDTDGALKEYEASVRCNGQTRPPFSTPHLSYGVFLHKLSRIDESEKQLRLAERLDPKDWMTHFELAKLLYDLDKFEEAAQELTMASQRAIPGSEDAQRAYRLLGRTYYRMGRENEARSALAAAGK